MALAFGASSIVPDQALYCGMPQGVPSGEVAHPYYKFWLNPLGLASPRQLYRRFGSRKLFDKRLQFMPGLTGEAEICRSCKTEVVTPAGLRSTKIGNRLALIVVISAEQDQLTLHHVLGFEPEL